MNEVWMVVEDRVRKDFDDFDTADKPMEKYCMRCRDEHISRVTQIIVKHIERNAYSPIQEIDNLIHELNHIFFDGAGAGLSLAWQWQKEKEKK